MSGDKLPPRFYVSVYQESTCLLVEPIDADQDLEHLGHVVAKRVARVITERFPEQLEAHMFGLEVRFTKGER